MFYRMLSRQSDFRETREVTITHGRDCNTDTVFLDRSGWDLEQKICASCHCVFMISVQIAARKCELPLRTVRETKFMVIKGKGKDHTITWHDGREGEQRNSSTLSLNKALGGGRRLALSPGKGCATHCAGPVWTDAENLAPTGIRSPDRPARSELLYRPSYPFMWILLEI
jgi:hypothetical protein